MIKCTLNQPKLLSTYYAAPGTHYKNVRQISGQFQKLNYLYFLFSIIQKGFHTNMRLNATLQLLTYVCNYFKLCF